MVNYNVQQPKKTPIGRDLRQYNSLQFRGKQVKGDRTEVCNIKNDLEKTRVKLGV